ncbi:hypothetical protein A4S05_21215 [Nostoc sp. KVJ20]|nr:hypothetical protein A4S05_21215 [Nostoc sp. KVJ20]
MSQSLDATVFEVEQSLMVCLLFSEGTKKRGVQRSRGAEEQRSRGAGEQGSRGAGEKEEVLGIRIAL